MPTTKEESDLVKSRVRWLQDRKMTPREFAETLDLDYGTCIRWFNEARVPRRLMKERIVSFFPDFPVKA